MSETIMLYHGTSKRRAKFILNEGMEGGYLTTLPALAEYFGIERMDRDGDEDFVILGVEVEISHLFADFFAYDVPIPLYRNKYTQSDQGWDEFCAVGVVPYPTDIKDWKTSINITYCAYYPNDISPTAITKLEPWSLREIKIEALEKEEPLKKKHAINKHLICHF